MILQHFLWGGGGGAGVKILRIFFKLIFKYNIKFIKGAGGGTLGSMEKEFECLVVRRGDGGHFAEKFVKESCS